MAKKRTVKSGNTVDNNPKVIEFKKPIIIETLVIKAETINMNRCKYDLNLCKRIVENINAMKHEIHTDADEKGGTGIIIGRTVSASIDKEGRVTVIAEVESKVFKGKKVEDFTLIPVGIGAVSMARYVVDYDFSCFAICLKTESSFYKEGIFIE